MRFITILIIVSLLIAGCVTSHITDQQVDLELGTIEPITDTDGCQFIQTAYFEVSHLSSMHYYAVKNVLHYGGDRYKIIGGTEDIAFGIKIHGTNIAIYRCED